MIEAEQYPDLYFDFAMPNKRYEKLIVAKSLSITQKQVTLPTIRLPHRFSVLAGLPIKIYQTIHDGALAFLVVISPNEKALEIPKIPRLHTAEAAGSNPAELIT